MNRLNSLPRRRFIWLPRNETAQKWNTEEKKSQMGIWKNLLECIFIVLFLFLNSIVQSHRQVSTTWAYKLGTEQLTCQRRRHIQILFECCIRVEHRHTGVTSIISLWNVEILCFQLPCDSNTANLMSERKYVRNALFRIVQENDLNCCGSPKGRWNGIIEFPTRTHPMEIRGQRFKIRAAMPSVAVPVKK